MQIDDSFKTFTIKPDGTYSVPNANAVAFSLVPITGTYPVTVVIDKDDKNPKKVESPRYLTDGVPFTLLEIKDATPGTTFAMRLLTNGASMELGRSTHSKKGHLLTSPPGVVMLFDMDTNTPEGAKAWFDLVQALVAENSLEQFNIRVDPQTPTRFTIVEETPTEPDEYYDTIHEPGPTWDLSDAREVVYGVEVWGEPQGDGTADRITPPFQLFAPFITLAETDGGPQFELVDFGSVGEFGNVNNLTIPHAGLHGVVHLGASANSVASNTRRLAKRAHYGRFDLAVKLTPEMSTDHFSSTRKYMRLYAYKVV